MSKGAKEVLVKNQYYYMLKYSVGLDISSKEVHACLSVIDNAQKVKVKASRKFINSSGGFDMLHQWIQKHHKQKEIPLFICMEATGIYHEECALYLFKKEFKVSIILPNKAKKYLQAVGLKSKNDRIDAQGLSRMGAEQSLPLWKPMGEYFYCLRAFTRQHQSLQEFKTQLSNQLHANMHGMYQNEFIINQLNNSLQHLDQQITAIEKAIEDHIKQNEQVAKKVENICKIKGLGLLSVAVVLAETNGFALFKNKRQLVSYSGYDVIENQSGKHVGKTRISKKGNSRIRRILHLPAFNVVKYDQRPFVQLFDRTFKKNNEKMKSYVAVQKKLLVIIYALWKKDEAYDSKFGVECDKGNHTGDQEQVPSSLLSFAEADCKKIAPVVADATQGRHTVERSQFASSLLLQS